MKWDRILYQRIECMFSQSTNIFNYQYNLFSVSFFHDFLKKLVKDACLVDLLLASVCAFLFGFFAGDGLLLFTGGSLIV